ncbi:MAG: pyridoxamine kinase [Clostridium sp.]
MKENIAIINDISGVGKCSLMVSIPIFSHFEIEANPIITAILSNQTAYEKFYFFDFTPYMKDYINVWENEGRKFNGIYSGFLGSEESIDIIEGFIKNHKESLVVIDPVMGDNDKIYTTYTKEMCEKIKALIKYADVVTPNLTEAKILTNTNLDVIIDETMGKVLAKKIANLGPKYVVLTGIIYENRIKNLAYDKENNEFYIVEEEYYPYSFSGTGDIFTSILTAAMLKGENILEALELSTKVIKEAIVDSIEQGITSTKEGINFERVLKGVKINE